MEHDLDKARNQKLLLSAFEQMSCLKINFYKCELFCYEEAVEAATDYADLFGCMHRRHLTTIMCMHAPDAQYKHAHTFLLTRLNLTDSFGN